MTEEDKENIQASEKFQEVLFRTSALVENALEENEGDIFFDYSGADKEDEYVCWFYLFVLIDIFIVI